MSDKQKVLILSDGTESIQHIAHSIENELSLCDVVICTVEQYKGVDLLAANIFFLGCEKANPPSFSYISQMFAHINMASRKCGIFSTDKKALKFLENLVKDSEASVGKPLLIKDSSNCANPVKEWVNHGFF